MKRAILCALALAALAVSTAAVADETTHTKPSALTPRHTSTHVYGAPIQPPIVSRHAKHKRPANSAAAH